MVRNCEEVEVVEVDGGFLRCSDAAPWFIEWAERCAFYSKTGEWAVVWSNGVSYDDCLPFISSVRKYCVEGRVACCIG